MTRHRAGRTGEVPEGERQLDFETGPGPEDVTEQPVEPHH